MEFSTFGSIMGAVIFVILIFVAAYYVTKLIGKGYMGMGAAAKEMTVIDKLALGHDRFLLIVRISEKTLLLGVTPQHIETLAELDGQQFSGLTAAQGNADFFTLFKDRLQKRSDHD
ncbi:MAG: flagellar biosynthetic protein FliO [Clostridiales bacterium]